MRQSGLWGFVLAAGVGLGLGLGLGGCHSSSSVNGDGGSTAPRSAPKTRYDMANGCYTLKSLATGAPATRDGDGYRATPTASSTAEAFYLKPSALGSYLLHAPDQTLLAVNGTAVARASAPSPVTDWTVDTVAEGRYTLVSIGSGQALAVAPESGQLVMVDAASAGASSQFGFVPASGCTPYPEMPVDMVGEAYKGCGADKPVIGFAEVHTHMAMSHEMSDGSGNVGPSAGGVLYGQMFNRYGVTEAMKDCIAYHGPEGANDPNNIIHQTPLVTHDTQGWPSFVDWPSAQSLTHQGMYYKWVERAWKAGLRIMVSHGTNIDSLCQFGRLAVARPDADCDDMSLGVKQVEYLHDLQDYVDAQEGGPGKGWFRIVKSPAEARAVINEGKLAVVPGVEFAHMFNCKVTFLPDGSEISGCDQAEIDRQIDRLYDLGVRQLFAYHDINSSLGGTGIFTGEIMNLLGFYDTQRFWDTYACPDGGEGDSYFYAAGAVMAAAVPGSGGDPLSQFVFGNLQGTLPLYPPGRQCNARGMTDLGRYAMQKMIAKKFVLDIDHAELTVKQDMIDMAKAQSPTYPLLSAHGGHGGITLQQARDILELGGLIYPYKPNGKGQVEFLQKVKAIWPAGRPLALGYGSDTNGFGGLAGPRGAGSEPVQYPFTLFKGEGWGPQFAQSCIKPVTVNLETIPESGKTWNVDETGMAHYGLVADFVEETRLEGGEEAISALYNSAEAYLQMWEKTVGR